MTTRRVSDGTLEQTGDARAAEAGGANRAATNNPLSYIIQPGSGENLAWARYAITIPATEGPAELKLSLCPVQPDPPGDPYPFEYYIGLAEYSRFAWEWHGPYTAVEPLTLNSEDVRGRYTSAGGVLHAVILVYAPDATAKAPTDPGAVQVDKLEVDTLTLDGGEFKTPRPYCVDFRVVSESYKPVPDVLMQWEPVLAPGETLTYHLYRQGPADPAPVELGTVPETDMEFTDPNDNAGGLPGPSRGLIYHYFIRAQSPLGASAMSMPYEVFIPPAGTWARTYGTGDVEESIGGGTDSAGNVYLVGNCTPYTYAQEYITALSLDPDGDLRWSKKYDCVDLEDIAYDALYAENDTLYFCGVTNMLNAADGADKLGREALLVGITNAGAMTLASTIGNGHINEDDAFNYLTYVSGDLIAGGLTKSKLIMARRSNAGVYSVLKYSETAEGYMGIGPMVTDTAGNLYVAGSTNLPVNGGTCIAKFSGSGTLIWSKSCDGMYYDSGSRLAVKYIALGPDGSIFTAGEGKGPYASTDVFIIKYGSTGELQWARCGGGNGQDRCRGLVVDDLGFAYLVSYHGAQSQVYQYETSVLRFSSEGTITRAKAWGSPDTGVIAKDCWMDANGYIYIAGIAANSNNIRSYPLTVGMEEISCLTQSFSVTPEAIDLPKIDHRLGTLTDLALTGDTGGGQDDLFIMKAKWPW